MYVLPFPDFQQPEKGPFLPLDYELVRIYHPDTVDSSVSSELAHARFQSITDAYNVLRGKTAAKPDPVSGAQQATTAARRAMHVRRHRELYEGGAVDDRWKDRMIIAGLIAVSRKPTFSSSYLHQTSDCHYHRCPSSHCAANKTARSSFFVL